MNPNLKSRHRQGSFIHQQEVSRLAVMIACLLAAFAGRAGADITFLNMLGWDVTTGEATGFESYVSGCKAGIAGSGDGQFNQPQGLAVHA